ncbi:TRAP transporter small permease [Paenalcaligenes faecalis]|uniref:TRAP transporter small permease n=1 Tax=Paenalcaligenes faecalis TaxID=2980099 RepID=UPI0022B9857B|nr:TRAP transporter small permease [Paenalcaligenes faecalis]
MSKRIVAICEGLIALTHGLAALLLVIATLLVFIQVITRFVFNDPATWTEVTARAVVIWMVFLAAGAAFRTGAMLALDLLHALLPQSMQRVLMGLISLLTLLFLCVLVWYGYLMTVRVHAQTVALLGIPTSWLYAAIPVGAGLAIPGVILHYFRPTPKANV